MINMSTGTKYPYCKPEVWGGIECTINRIGDVFRDQLHYSGHYLRTDDIEKFAALGIKKIRYPILWEYHQPHPDTKIDWQWAAQQLNSIQQNNIMPVAGLLHHGSGPAFTHLLDKKFPEKLAAYAAKVAQRFPWIEHYTPVNEPLTTARFSGLYGIWYPHHKKELSFAKMLINQLKGVVLSMQAIRKINPQAKLVQTEDLGKTHSTNLLKYQAAFENKRRWLTNDLLCGKVDKKHFFWNYLIRLGVNKKDLEFFLLNPCPPDIIGFNYYVTSERYLDENIANYAGCAHDGNGRHVYVDTEAVRAGRAQGLQVLLTEAWKRYHRPIAVTECHLSCTREEQLRWFYETWQTCCELQKQNIDIRAITAWSLLGAYDWNSLLTCQNNCYEPGVFDISNNNFRETALAKMIKELAAVGNYDHPLLIEKGWWHKKTGPLEKRTKKRAAPLMIIGARGTLGQAFSKICELRSIPFVALTRNELDICKENDIEKVVDSYKPWAIINTAGFVKVDEAETNSDECFAVNAIAPGIMAKLCDKRGIRFMTFSSDLVFDGNKRSPYHEADNVRPLNIYGASKANAEQVVKAVNNSALIIRTSAFFGPWDQYNFVYAVLDALKNEKQFPVAKDVYISPTYVPDLVNMAMDLFIDEEKGIWHLSNDGILTWSDFACAIADRAGFSKKQFVLRSLEEMGWKAPRPLYSVLGSEKGIKMPGFDNAMERYFQQKAV
jgi:dTDP-4-dehydrorhamnose reductase